MNKNYAVVMKSDRGLPAVKEGTLAQVLYWLSTERVDEHDVYTPEGDYVDAERFMEEKNPLEHKFYEMDPETEDVIPGRDLANGMKVLVESSLIRKRTLEDGLGDDEIRQSDERNRWCEVSKISFHGNEVEFAGIYADGVKRWRVIGSRIPWIVKKDSLHAANEKKKIELRGAIYDQALRLVLGDEAILPPEADEEAFVNEVVDEIMKLI